MRLFLSICVIFSLWGCGYRWHYDYPEGTRPSLVVTPIYKDEQGSMATEIIACLDASGLVRVVPNCGDYRLEVSIGSARDDAIGYRRDPQKIKQKIKKNLVACEGRKTLQVDVRIYRKDTKELAFGPYYLEANADYDYVDGDSLQDLTFGSGLIKVLPFSLGQLESIESAQAAVTNPIYHTLAQKIVDVLSSEW